jgi:DNA-binding Xre family transcriptional regulator
LKLKLLIKKKNEIDLVELKFKENQMEKKISISKKNTKKLKSYQMKKLKLRKI